MVKLFLPIAIAFLLSACAGATGVQTASPCLKCKHHCEHCMTGDCEHCKEGQCRAENEGDTSPGEKPCQICLESEQASQVNQ